MLVPVNTLYGVSYFQCVVAYIHLIIEVSVHYGELLQEWVQGGLEMAEDDVNTNVIYEMLTLIELHRLEEAVNNTSNCYCLIQLYQTWEEMASDLLKTPIMTSYKWQMMT